MTSVLWTRTSTLDRKGGGYRVIPLNADGEQVYMVVTALGLPLYSFTDLHTAVAEAAALNAR